MKGLDYFLYLIEECFDPERSPNYWGVGRGPPHEVRVAPYGPQEGHGSALLCRPAGESKLLNSWTNYILQVTLIIIEIIL